jgi:multiple sugar transport system substrate-binding protein
MQNWIERLSITTVVFIIFALLFYSVFLINRQPEEEEKITKVYFADNISKAHLELIQKFNQEYKNRIEVFPINLPFSKFTTNERKKLLTRALRSKSDRIDIFAVDLIWVQRFTRWAEPLDLYFSSMDRADILDQALISCYSHDNLVAIPLYLDIGLMYYRDDILKTLDDYDMLSQRLKESLTWSEFIDLSNRIQKNFPFTYLFAADNFEGLVCNYLELLYGQEGSLFEADSILLNTSESLKALNLLIDMIHKYRIVPKEVTNFHENECYLYGLENDVPFFKGWPGLTQQYNDWIPNPQKLKEIKMAPLPHFQGFTPRSVYGGWNLMVSKDSNKKSAAVEFIKFVLKPENQSILFEKGGYLPVSKLVYLQSEDSVNQVDLKFYLKLIEKGFHRPFLQDYTKISDMISYYVQLALKKEISADQALTQATRIINSKQILIK